MKMQIYQLIALCAFATSMLVVAPSTAAPVSISIGVKLEPSNWQGSNYATDSKDFESDTGRLGLSVGLQKGSFYAGINIKGGEFEFKNGSPDQITATGVISSDQAVIQRSEVDLLFGYYLWRRFSLFVDLKNSGNKWQDPDYELVSSGLGVGGTGYYPLSQKWIIFGSIGFIKLNLTVDDEEVGTGTGGAVEIGFMYRMTERTSLTLNARNQTRVYELDNGSKQTYEIGVPLVIGISYRLGG